MVSGNPLYLYITVMIVDGKGSHKRDNVGGMFRRFGGEVDCTEEEME